jgi:hypothetical protein
VGKKYFNTLDPVFSPDGSHLAYAAQVDSGKFVCVFDGQETAEYPLINNIVFSANGQRRAFVAGVFGAGQTAVIDGNAGETSGFPWVDPIVFASDSARVGYVGNTNLALGGNVVNESIVVVNGQFVEKLTDARAYGPFFGSQNTIAYIIQTGARFYMKVNDRKEGPYARVGAPIFSNDGKHSSYTALDGLTNSFKIVVDGNVLPDTYISVTMPRFTGNDSVEYVGLKGTGGQLSLVRVKKDL